MSNDKLAERQRFESWYTTHAHNYSRDPIGSRDCALQWDAWEAALQAHAAEAAHAQAQSGEWVQKAIIVDAKGDIEYVHVRIFNAMKARAEEAEAMLAAAPQQAAEPVGYVSADILKTFGNGDLSSIRLWRSSDDFVGPVVEVYTHPQPAQAAKDAARLDWLEAHPRLASIVIDGNATDCYFYGISGAPGLKLREILDAAMAKESWR